MQKTQNSKSFDSSSYDRAIMSPGILYEKELLNEGDRGT